MSRNILLIAAVVLGLGEAAFGQSLLSNRNGVRVVVPPAAASKPTINRLPNGRWIMNEISSGRFGIQPTSQPTPRPTPLPYPTPQPYPQPQPQPRPNPQPTPLPYPMPQPQPQPHPQPSPVFIPPSHGQYPIHVTPNEVVGVNPQTGGLDTQNRQIDNTVLQHGRDESQNNGTKRWVRRPVYNSQGQVVGYQEGWVWNNSYTGQEHGELTNYTPNGQGGTHQQHQSRSVQRPGGVHKNIQSFSVQPGQKPATKTAPAPGGVHRNIQSFGARTK